jgi:hypothetical protein
MTTKQMLNDQFDVYVAQECSLCGVKYDAATWPHEIQGVPVCVRCSRLAPIVHYVRFVRFLASKECEVIYETFDYPDEDYQTSCSLQCTCPPCTARNVIRQHQKFLSHRRK